MDSFPFFWIAHIFTGVYEMIVDVDVVVLNVIIVIITIIIVVVFPFVVYRIIISRPIKREMKSETVFGFLKKKNPKKKPTIWMKACV